MSIGLHALVENHRPRFVQSWSDTYSDGERNLVFDLDLLQMDVILSSDLRELVSFLLHDIKGKARRKELDTLRSDTRSIIKSAFISPPSETALAVALLQALERTAEHFTTVASDAAGWDALVGNQYNLDFSSIDDFSRDLLGMPIQDIVADIPDDFRVIHIESVVRGDLLYRFNKYRRSLAEILNTEDAKALWAKLPFNSRLRQRNRNGLRREDIVADMLTPRVVFHGTPLQNVGSIVRSGFLHHGDIAADGKTAVTPQAHSVWHRGIYASQSAGYALSYAEGQDIKTPLGRIPSMRLIVCAAIEARTYMGDTLSVHCGEVEPGYDTHFDGSFEHIFFAEAGLLPCYVIHLDLGAEAAREAILACQNDAYSFHSRPRSRLAANKKTAAAAPGDARRLKEASKAAARKRLPYGFGPTSSKKFVVEEVGDISDDEEEYGRWQADKHMYVAEDCDLEAQNDAALLEEAGRNTEPGCFLDQYQAYRTVYAHKPKGKKQMTKKA